MSALDDDIATHMEARRLRRAQCERVWSKGHPDDRKEHLRQLALGATETTTPMDIAALRLRALGVDVTELNAALDAAHEALLRAATPVLAEVIADTPEQAEGRKR